MESSAVTAHTLPVPLLLTKSPSSMTLAILREIQVWISQPCPSPTAYSHLPSDELPREASAAARPNATKSDNTLLWSLVPFFIAKPLGRTSRSLPRPSSTSYVNGLRGVACFVVLHQHIAWQVARWIQQPYGADANNYHFWQLPFVRLAHCGLFMVAVFFVLSGFVLAYSPLKKINTPSDPARDSALLRSLSSAAPPVRPHARRHVLLVRGHLLVPSLRPRRLAQRQPECLWHVVEDDEAGLAGAQRL